MTRHTTKFLEKCLQLALISTIVSGIENFQSVFSSENNNYIPKRDSIINQYPVFEKDNVQWSKELKTQEQWNLPQNYVYNTNNNNNINQPQPYENADNLENRDWHSIPVNEEDIEKREPISQQLIMSPKSAYDDVSALPSNNVLKWNGGNLNLEPIEVKPWTSLTSNNGFQHWNSPTSNKNDNWDKLINDVTNKIMEQTKLHVNKLSEPIPAKSEHQVQHLNSANTNQQWNNIFSQSVPSPVNWAPPKSATIDLTHLGNVGSSTKTTNFIQPTQVEAPKYNFAATYNQGYSLPTPKQEHHQPVQEIKVPVPQPYMVPVPVPQPFKVPIFKVVPKEVEKKVPITVEKLVPKYIEKPYKIEVEIHHPKPMIKKYPVHVPVQKKMPKKRLHLRKKTVRWY